MFSYAISDPQKPYEISKKGAITYFYAVMETEVKKVPQQARGLRPWFSGIAIQS